MKLKSKDVSLALLAILFSSVSAIAKEQVASGGSDEAGAGSPPLVSNLDKSYSRSKTSAVCKKNWNDIKKNKPKESMALNEETILKNAQGMGLNMSYVKRTLAAYKANQANLPNQGYVTVIDFDKRSNQKRFYLIGLQTGRIWPYHTAAGKGSDPDGNGYATKFTNKGGSLASSLGCYVVGGTFKGKGGKRPSMFMHGLEDTNNNACDRAIIIHPASYVGGVPGRSWGCPALRPGDYSTIEPKIKGGSLMCAFQGGK